MYKILIVEDDQGIAQGIKKELMAWNYEVCCVNDFQNVMSLFATFSPHLVLMDISLPFYNGYYWCEKIRSISKVPIIFITSASDNMNIIMAMNMGGDDFVAKPFDVQAMLRRTYDFSNSVTVFEHRGAMLNTNDSTLVYEGKNIELSRNEYRILLTLMKNKGKVVRREKLMEALWETDSFIDENTLTVNVSRLRHKLSDAGLDHFITTRSGEGYIIL